MKKAYSYVILGLMLVFWLFRVFVLLKAQNGESLSGFVAYDFNVEVIVLFISTASIFLVYKRKLIGAIAYLLSYGFYFGTYLIVHLSSFQNLNVSVAVMGLIIALLAFLDLLSEKVSLKEPSDKKTDWYFKSKEYDRNLDDRADKNNYKFY